MHMFTLFIIAQGPDYCVPYLCIGIEIMLISMESWQCKYVVDLEKWSERILDSLYTLFPGKSEIRRFHRNESYLFVHL